MKNWETTFFGILSSVGAVLATSDGFSKTIHLIGTCCLAAGQAGMGLQAASIRGVDTAIKNGKDNHAQLDKSQ